jgi:pantetheine-phosphate adenylyltransferase
MDKIAVFPGSFDPFTVGHESVLSRALSLFDRIFVMVGINQSKNSFFTVEQRSAMISKVFYDEPKVVVESYNGLTIDYCKKVGATHILRGLRTSADFEFERAIAQINKKMHYSIETVFLLTMPEHTPVNSTIVRDILRYGGDVSQFIPKGVDINKFLEEKKHV